MGDPNVIANMWYEAYVEKAIWEQEYPKGTALESLLAFMTEKYKQ